MNTKKTRLRCIVVMSIVSNKYLSFRVDINLEGYVGEIGHR